jgi:hypothetical protein
MILKGEAQQTRILLESLTQHQAPQFQVMVYHASLKHNQTTCDCYFLMKHIVFRLAQVPLIHEFLMLQPRDLYFELTQKWDLASLQEATAQVFLDFLKVISHLNLSCNLVVLVHGAENLFVQEDLSNFIYVLRAAGDQIPAFLKFVFAVERRKKNFHVLNKIVNLLRTKQIVTLDTDQDPLLEESSMAQQMKSYWTEQQCAEILEATKPHYKQLCEVVSLRLQGADMAECLLQIASPLKVCQDLQTGA